MDTSRLVPHPCGPRLLRGWLERHQHPFSFYLHLAGIPMTLLALPLLTRHQWRRAVGLFGGGYTLQFLGHLVEGNPPGEVLALRRRLAGRRFAAFAGKPGPRQLAQTGQVTHWVMFRGRPSGGRWTMATAVRRPALRRRP